jgi:hypothetical protein
VGGGDGGGGGAADVGGDGGGDGGGAGAAANCSPRLAALRIFSVSWLRSEQRPRAIHAAKSTLLSRPIAIAVFVLRTNPARASDRRRRIPLENLSARRW